MFCHIALTQPSQPFLSLNLSVFILMLTRKLTSEILLERPVMKVFLLTSILAQSRRRRRRPSSVGTDCQLCRSLALPLKSVGHVSHISCFYFSCFFFFVSFSIFHFLFSASWRCVFLHFLCIFFECAFPSSHALNYPRSRRLGASSSALVQATLCCRNSCKSKSVGCCCCCSRCCCRCSF